MRLFFLLLGFLSISLQAAACVPILPLTMLFSGVFLSAGSLSILTVIVMIKAMIFITFEKRLPLFSAFIFMVLANILSSILGLFLGVAFAVPFLLIIIIPTVFALSMVPATRLVQNYAEKYSMLKDRGSIAGILVLLFLGTFFLFFFSQGVASDSKISITYWLIKFLYVFLGLIISIGLTTIWEEWVIALCVRHHYWSESFYPSVLKANLATSLFIFGYAAIKILPQRLSTPNFLVQLF